MVKQMFQSLEENYVFYRRRSFIPEAISHSQLQKKLVICVAGSNQCVILKDFNED